MAKPSFDSPQGDAAKIAHLNLGEDHLVWEGVKLPPAMRPGAVTKIFGIGKAVLYARLNSGEIRSVALREKPGQKRATRLVYTRSLLDFLKRCEERGGK